MNALHVNRPQDATVGNTVRLYGRKYRRAYISWLRCRVKMAHVRQSRPNSGLGFQVKDLLLVTRAKKKKKKKKIDVDRLTRSHKWSILQRSSTKLCLSLFELTMVKTMPSGQFSTQSERHPTDPRRRIKSRLDCFSFLGKTHSFLNVWPQEKGKATSSIRATLRSQAWRSGRARKSGESVKSRGSRERERSVALHQSS